jgi:signal transduction histidine kinase
MNSERERISAELHDELGSTLSGISMYSHLMKSQIQKHHFQNLLQSVEIVQKSSQEMIDKIYEIIWMLNPQENSIQHVANQLRQFGSKMATVGNFFFEMNDSVKNSLKVSPEVLKNVYLIFKEAINNAVKYSHASQLVLKIGQANENELIMVLEDNGVGFDQGTVRQGNGLKNMQDRAKKINAKIVLDSKKDIGTKVVLTLNMKM